MVKLDQVAKLAGLGAYGAIAGMSAAYAAFIMFTAPTAGSGLDMTNSLVTWISVGGVLIALIAGHITIARQLLRLSQGLDKKHPL
jgi:hypothetical protein